MMIQADLKDRTEYGIDGNWCVHEIISVCCPKCKLDTVETITYPEMTLYYHDLGAGEQLGLCVVGKGAGRIPAKLEPFFEAQPMSF